MHSKERNAKLRSPPKPSTIVIDKHKRNSKSDSSILIFWQIITTCCTVCSTHMYHTEFFILYYPIKLDQLNECLSLLNRTCFLPCIKIITASFLTPVNFWTYHIIIFGRDAQTNKYVNPHFQSHPHLTKHSAVAVFSLLGDKRWDHREQRQNLVNKVLSFIRFT